MVNNSLNKKKDFEKLYQKGVFVRSSGMSFRYLKNLKQGLRCVFRVSKKQVKHATDRNKLKRWGRAVLKQNPNLKTLNLDLLINIHYVHGNYKEFKQEMENLLKKISRE